MIRKVENQSLEDRGWISVDRGTKATLTLTIPRSLFKSSTKDLSFPIFELVIRPRLTRPFCGTQSRDHVMILDFQAAYTYSW